MQPLVSYGRKKMSRQKEINIKLVIGYSLLVNQIQEWILTIESDGVTSFKKRKELSKLSDIIKLFEYEEQEYIGYIEEVTKAEKKKARAVVTRVGLIEKLANVSEELINLCRFQ